MEENNNEVEHKEGVLNIFLEHKFFVISVGYISWLFIYKQLLGNTVSEGYLIFTVLAAVVLFFYSLFMELPHSRYPLVQLIGHLAWYIAIGLSLLMGWVRWISTD